MDIVRTRKSTRMITCSCRSRIAFHSFLEHRKSHLCGEHCQDRTCRELGEKSSHFRPIADTAIYFSSTPFRDPQIWETNNSFWAVVGDAKSKKRVWILCKNCAKDVEINDTALYLPNGYEAEWREHPKSGDMTYYFPPTFKFHSS